ncbi:MAG: hypothetical protein EBV34_18695 [Betaproteobacteria bacterium]|nr:hypothetical protein [Betaproteobacteria bacterium]
MKSRSIRIDCYIANRMPIILRSRSGSKAKVSHKICGRIDAVMPNYVVDRHRNISAIVFDLGRVVIVGSNKIEITGCIGNLEQGWKAFIITRPAVNLDFRICPAAVIVRIKDDFEASAVGGYSNTTS